jgi:hypothetical protein
MLTVYLTCPFADRAKTRHEFMKRLHLRYKEEGIEMPSPSRTLTTQPDEPLRVVIGDPTGAPAPAGGAQAAVEGREEVPGT